MVGEALVFVVEVVVVVVFFLAGVREGVFVCGAAEAMEIVSRATGISGS